MFLGVFLSHLMKISKQTFDQPERRHLENRSFPGIFLNKENFFKAFQYKIQDCKSHRLGGVGKGMEKKEGDIQCLGPRVTGFEVGVLVGSTLWLHRDGD